MMLLVMKLKNVSLGGFQKVFQMTESFVGQHSVLQMFNFVFFCLFVSSVSVLLVHLSFF